jgi:hypothetical protein
LIDSPEKGRALAAANNEGSKTELPVGSIPPRDEGGNASSEANGEHRCPVKGTVKIRHQFAPAEMAIERQDPDLLELLRTPIDGQETPVMDFWKADVTVLDIDNHDANHVAEEVDALLRWLPGYDCAHRTHRNGAHAFFMGDNHRQRAWLSSLFVPKGFTVEIKRDARHPLGKHPSAPETTCGPVIVGPGGPVRLEGETVDEAERDTWLAEHVMEIGTRYTHDRCPISPDDATSGSRSVVVNAQGIKCFHCEAQDKRCGDAPPGWYPFGRRHAGIDEMSEMVDHHVHWAHARHVLRHFFPGRSDRLLQQAYAAALAARHGPDDPRTWMVFNPDLKVVLIEPGVWAHDGTFTPIPQPHNDLLDSLPVCYDVKPEETEDDDEKEA